MIIFFIFVFGLAVGSFLNVCIDRLSFEESLFGRSHCDHCKKKLPWADLIPVFSWILLTGKCRYCKKRISVFYPTVELVTGAAFAFVWLYGFSLIIGPPHVISSAAINLMEIDQSLRYIGMTISLMGIISSLIVIFFADLKYHIIPDEAIVAMIIFSLPVIVRARHALPLRDYITGALVLFLILYSLYFITRGRGMGFGDVKYAAAMGLLLGLKSGFIALYLSFVLGGVVSVFLILFGKKGLKSKIAFGPFLIIGTVIMLFWQEPVFAFLRQFFPFI